MAEINGNFPSTEALFSSFTGCGSIRAFSLCRAKFSIGRYRMWNWSVFVSSLFPFLNGGPTWWLTKMLGALKDTYYKDGVHKVLFSAHLNWNAIAFIVLYIILLYSLNVVSVISKERLGNRKPLCAVLLTCTDLIVLTELGVDGNSNANNYVDSVKLPINKCYIYRPGLDGLLFEPHLRLNYIYVVVFDVIRAVCGYIWIGIFSKTTRSRVHIYMPGHGIVEFRETSDIPEGYRVSGNKLQGLRVSLQELSRRAHAVA